MINAMMIYVLQAQAHFQSLDLCAIVHWEGYFDFVQEHSHCGLQLVGIEQGFGKLKG